MTEVQSSRCIFLLKMPYFGTLEIVTFIRPQEECERVHRTKELEWLGHIWHIKESWATGVDTWTFLTDQQTPLRKIKPLRQRLGLPCVCAKEVWMNQGCQCGGN